MTWRWRNMCGFYGDVSSLTVRRPEVIGERHFNDVGLIMSLHLFLASLIDRSVCLSCRIVDA